MASLPEFPQHQWRNLWGGQRRPAKEGTVDKCDLCGLKRTVVQVRPTPFTVTKTKITFHRGGRRLQNTGVVVPPCLDDSATFFNLGEQ